MLTYLASPYSHPDPAVREARFVAVCKVAGEMMGRGHVVYSPIAHSHPIAMHCDLPKDWLFWGKQDRTMIALCDRVVVLTIDGWQESTGVQAEIEYAKSIGKPVTYMTDIPVERLEAATC